MTPTVVHAAAPAQDAGRLRRPGAGRAVLSGAGAGLSAGVLALVLGLAALVVVVPRLLGGVPLTVLSGSMEPSLPVGSLAVVLPVDPHEVRVGDIVTYLPNPEDPTAVTHRVMAIAHHQDGSRTFTTQGDANAAPDAPVSEEQVRARLAYAVPLLGYVNDALNGEERPVAVYVVVGALLVWALRLWRRAWQDRRRSNGSSGTGAAQSPAHGEPSTSSGMSASRARSATASFCIAR